MNRHLGMAIPTILMIITAVLTMLAGCGEKIAIPQPVGEWSLAPFTFDDEFIDPEGPTQLTQQDGALFVITPTALTKRNQEYDEEARLDGLDQATALCVEPDSGYVFLWQEGPGRISWHNSKDLVELGYTDVTGVGSVTAMATNPSGIHYVPGALTFLYLSDPVNGLVHRLSFDIYTGFSSYGILSRSDGDGTRFVHIPAGMATDYEDSLLVCDVDTNRNWVIRFVSEPDTTDTSPDPGEPDPLRGRSTVFNVPTCVPAAAADFVLGDAAECQESDWVGGPSDLEGEFHTPTAVAVDGDGLIFVSDTSNDRIQLFTPEGFFDLWFGNGDVIPGPTSLALVEKRTGPSVDEIFASGYVYVLCPTDGKVVRFISRDYFNARAQSQPPPPPP